VTITAVRPQTSVLAALPAAIRVRQWTKNLLVLAPLLPAAGAVGSTTWSTRRSTACTR
jgi:hypothetical protein